MNRATSSKRSSVAALRAVARSGDRHALLRLARSLLDDPRYDVRVAATEALGKSRGAGATAMLARVLRDDDAIVVVTAIEGLVEHEATRLVDRLPALLDDEDELVRAYAAWGIGKLAGKRFVPALRAHLRGLTDVVEVSALCEALYLLTARRVYLERLFTQLRSSDPEARAFTTNSLSGCVTHANGAAIIGAMAAALAREQNEVVVRSLRRDLKIAVEALADAATSAAVGARGGGPRRRTDPPRRGRRS